jgi:hypothetical protein
LFLAYILGHIFEVLISRLERQPATWSTTFLHSSSAASIDSELTEDDIAAILKPVPACRSLTPIDVADLLQEFERNPEIATIVAYNDFPYTRNNTLTPPEIEREYWVKVDRSSLKNHALAGHHSFVIFHVHYKGTWVKSDDQTMFDRKRSIIAQINARHTWDGRNEAEKFFKKCEKFNL